MTVRIGGNYKLLLIHAVLIQLASFVVRPAATYRAIELNVDPAYIGIIIASFALVPFFVSVFIGRASDRGYNSQVLVAGSIILVLVGFGFLFFANSVAQLIIWISILGLGHVMCVIGEQSLVVNRSSDNLDGAFGMYMFAGSLGQTIGPALILVAAGGKIIPNTNLLFLYYLLASLIVFGVTFALISSVQTSNNYREVSKPGNLLTIWKNVEAGAKPKLIIAMLVSFISIGSVDVLSIYLPALGIERGIPAATIGILLSVRALTTTVSRFYLGKLSRYFGRNQLITLSTSITGLLMLIIALPTPILLMVIFILLLGFAIGIGQPLTMSIITLSVSPVTINTWLGLRLSANRIGQSTVPATVGLTTAAFGVGGAFGSTGFLLLTVAVLSKILLPATPKSPNEGA
jgi:MFS family permease